MLSLLRLRSLRRLRVENSRNPGRVAVAMLVSPMLFTVFLKIPARRRLIRMDYSVRGAVFPGKLQGSING